MQSVLLGNSKGGVAKTTSSVAMSAALAELGYKVLLIDNDPQANSTRAVGKYGKTSPQNSITGIMEDLINFSASSNTHINPFDMVDGYAEHKSSAFYEKSNFIVSLFEQIDKSELLGGNDKSIIDRCVINIYKKCKQTPNKHKTKGYRYLANLSLFRIFNRKKERADLPGHISHRPR